MATGGRLGGKKTGGRTKGALNKENKLLKKLL